MFYYNWYISPISLEVFGRSFLLSNSVSGYTQRVCTSFSRERWITFCWNSVNRIPLFLHGYVKQQQQLCNNNQEKNKKKNKRQINNIISLTRSTNCGWRCVCVITASRCNGKAKTFLSTVSRANEEGRNCARSLSTRHPFLYSRLWIIYICIFKSYRNSNRFFFEENVDPCRFQSFEWIFVRFPKIQMVSINWPTAINLRATSFFGENYAWKDLVASTFR